MIQLLKTYLILLLAFNFEAVEGYRLPTFSVFMQSRRREIPSYELEKYLENIKEYFVGVFNDIDLRKDSIDGN